MTFAKFDLDSTLVNSDELIALALAEQGFMLDPDNHDSFHFNFLDDYGPPPDFQWDVFFYRLFTERFDELKPVDEFVNRFLEKIYDDCPIHIITARPEGTMMHHACMSTLERCFPNVEFSVSVVGGGSDKVRYMGGSSILFEDRRKTALEVAKTSRIVLMPNKGYNHILEPNGTRVISIEDCRFSEWVYNTIITFDNYEQVINSNILGLIRTF